MFCGPLSFALNILRLALCPQQGFPHMLFASSTQYESHWTLQQYGSALHTVVAHVLQEFVSAAPIAHSLWVQALPVLPAHVPYAVPDELHVLLPVPPVGVVQELVEFGVQTLELLHMLAASLTQAESQLLLQQYGSVLHTVVAQALQELTNFTPLTDSLWAQTLELPAHVPYAVPDELHVLEPAEPAEVVQEVAEFGVQTVVAVHVPYDVPDELQVLVPVAPVEVAQELLEFGVQTVVVQFTTPHETNLATAKRQAGKPTTFAVPMLEIAVKQVTPVITVPNISVPVQAAPARMSLILPEKSTGFQPTVFAMQASASVPLRSENLFPLLLTKSIRFSVNEK